MAFSETFMLEHDLDVFFNYNGHPVHLATRGSLLPENLNDEVRQGEIWDEVMRQQNGRHEEDVEINDDFLARMEIKDRYENLGFNIEWLLGRLEKGDRLQLPQHYSVEVRLYSHTFYRYALRGFYSFYYSPERNNYFLVAWPSNPRDVNGLPELNTNEVLDFQNPKLLVDVKFANI